MVDDSFVPSSKQPSVIYCRLTDFWSVFSVYSGTDIVNISTRKCHGKVSKSAFSVRTMHRLRENSAELGFFVYRYATFYNVWGSLFQQHLYALHIGRCSLKISHFLIKGGGFIFTFCLSISLSITL